MVFDKSPEPLSYQNYKIGSGINTIFMQFLTRSKVRQLSTQKISKNQTYSQLG